MAMKEPVRPLPPFSAGPPVAPTMAGLVVRRLGGRYSREMGICVDGGDAEVERWFLAATLFGTRITAKVAERTFGVLEDAGIRRVADITGWERRDLVVLLDSGGYARYDLRMADRLKALAGQVCERYGGEVAQIGRRFGEPADLASALDDLDGWGPVTVGLFLRELRGVWPAARPPLDRRAEQAGHHLGIFGDRGDPLDALFSVARLSRCDARDLEGALVRLALGHPATGSCLGGRGCVMLAEPARAVSGVIRTIALPGGRVITIRPMRAQDAPGLVALYASLDEEDVYRRFFGGRPPPEPFVTKMAAVAQAGGAGLVATLSDPGGDAGGEAAGDGCPPEGKIVAEAAYHPLENGDAELGITVTRSMRGWLGPYLLDALVECAGAHGIPNLQADVLMANRQMLAMLRRRGYAVLGFEEGPALVRLVAGTVGKVPSWPGPHTRRRVLVESPSGYWHAADAIRRAGFDVIGCPSPPGGWAACPALRGEPCPLAAGADVIVCAVPGEQGRCILDAHRRVHPAVPLCAEATAEAADPGPVAERFSRDTPSDVVEAVLERVVGHDPHGRDPAGAP